MPNPDSVELGGDDMAVMRKRRRFTLEEYRQSYRDRRLVDRAGTIAALAFSDVVLPVREVVG
jgi:hypothetical protein